MFALSPLVIFWWVCIFGFIILYPVYYNYDRLPYFLQQAVTYGKIRGRQRGDSIIDLLFNVPKRFFLHFYILSLVWNSTLLICLINSWFLGGTFPAKLLELLSYLSYYPDRVPCSHLSITLALGLIVFQAARRTYESVFVSVYSDGKMHMIHYVLGMAFYSALGLSALSKAPNLNTGTFLQINDIRWNHVVGVVLFVWATVHHHRAHQIFASLRKGKNDKGHKIPYGDWFEYVSCPHYLAEILIYLSIQIVLDFDHTVWLAVFMFTLTNQTVAAMFTHRWYRGKFRMYPKERKAVFPWIL